MERHKDSMKPTSAANMVMAVITFSYHTGQVGNSLFVVLLRIYKKWECINKLQEINLASTSSIIISRQASHIQENKYTVISICMSRDLQDGK